MGSLNSFSLLMFMMECMMEANKNNFLKFMSSNYPEVFCEIIFKLNYLLSS